MECIKVQKQIIPFVNDCLNKRDLENFLNHIKSCESCKEEYDVYYTLLMGMRLLEEDSIAGTFHLDADEKLYDAKRHLWRARAKVLGKWLLFILYILICILYL